MKRLSSALLAVCMCTHPVVPVLAQQGAVITITSMDRGSVRPFDRLVISGSGFQPASAAISVLFVPRQHGVPVAIPAFSATATRIEVIVPAFFDLGAGDFGFGQSDVQVVQVTRDQVMSSNILTGLDVAPVAALPASVGTGKVTQAFMQLSVEFLGASSGAVFDAFKTEQTALLTKVDAVVANPDSDVPATTIDASPFMVSGPMLKTSDRLIAAFLASLAPVVRSQRLDDRAIAMLGENCVLNTGSAEVDNLLCQLRVAVFGAGPNWQGGVSAIGGGIAVLVIATAIAPVALGVGVGVGIAGAGVALAGAGQLAYLAAASTLGQSLLADGSPSLPYTLRDHVRAIFTTANENQGAPITTATMAATDAVAFIAARDTGRPNSSPSGGTVVLAPAIGSGDSTRLVTAFQGSGAAVTATRVAVPANQSTRTFFEARIIPPPLSWYDGAYLGFLNVTGSARGKQESGVLDLSFTVLGGVFTIIGPPGGAGTVDANGRVTSGLGACSLTGAIEVSAPGPHGPGIAGGALPLCRNGEYTGWGSWRATRAPRP